MNPLKKFLAWIAKPKPIEEMKMTDVLVQSGVADPALSTLSELTLPADASALASIAAPAVNALQDSTATLAPLSPIKDVGNFSATLVGYSGDPLESAIQSIAQLINDLPATAERLSAHLEKLLAGQLAKLGVA